MKQNLNIKSRTHNKTDCRNSFFMIKISYRTLNQNHKLFYFQIVLKGSAYVPKLCNLCFGVRTILFHSLNRMP